METENAVLTGLSYGLAGLVYFVFALILLRRGYLRRPREAGRVMLVVAVLSSALWGCLLIVALFGGQRWLVGAWYFTDMARYGAWYVFLLVLLRVGRQEKETGGFEWLIPGAAAVLGAGAAFQFAATPCTKSVKYAFSACIRLACRSSLHGALLRRLHGKCL